MPQSITLRPTMGADVLRHLSRFGELPSKGVLAGQAVDSAITDLWGGGGGVYNDLDIFRQCPSAAYRPHEKANATAMRSQLSMSNRQTYSGMALLLETVDTYGIASVSRQGMLNYVNCVMASGRFAHKLTVAQVISGFDLNCTRVGLDLETGLLHWDSHYEQFLASRQLRIAMMHTPYHTFLRLAKKAQELPGVYADMSQAAQACAGVARSKYVRQMLKDRDISLLFGSKHLELAQAHSSAWQGFFSLEQKDFRRKSAGAVWNDTSPEELANNPNDQVAKLWALTPRGDVDPALQARIDRLGKASLFFAGRVVEEACRRKSDQVYVKLDVLRDHRKVAAANLGLEVNRDHVFQHLDLLGTSYVEGQALPAVSDKVESFLRKHSEFSGLLLGQTLAQQWATIQRLQKLVRRFCTEVVKVDSDAPWGVLETQASAVDLESDEKVWQLLLSDHERQSKPFDVAPLPMPGLPARWAQEFVVEELLTPGELTREGAQMGHCVGGYAHSVRTGRCRIVRIRNPRKPTQWSTVELVPHRSKKGKQPVWEVGQHRARSNKAPAPVNEEILKFLLAYWNLPPTAFERYLDGSLHAWALSRQRAHAAMVRGMEKTVSTLSRMLQNLEARLTQERKELHQAESDLHAAELLREVDKPV